MKLPNAASAVVPEEKIVDYLLSETHRDGRHKAAFFRGLGYTAERPEELRSALISIANQDDVLREENSPFGTRMVVDGMIKTRVGRTAYVRTVWFIEHGESTPRFVTAYPAPVRRQS